MLEMQGLFLKRLLMKGYHVFLNLFGIGIKHETSEIVFDNSALNKVKYIYTVFVLSATVFVQYDFALDGTESFFFVQDQIEFKEEGWDDD